MAQRIAAAPQPTLDQIRATAERNAESERAENRENTITVKQNAREYLGHIYDKKTRRIGEKAVEDFQDELLLVEREESHYEATFEHTKETALDRWKNSFDFTIGATIPVGPKPKIEGGIDIGRTTTDSSESSSSFCIVACVKAHKCLLRALPERLDVKPKSLQVGIAGYVNVFAGYRIVLEIIFSSNKSEKKTTVGANAKASTLSTVIGGGLNFKHENSSLKDRNIEQISVIAQSVYGSYKVPELKILKSDDFTTIQGKFESIRNDFLYNFYKIANRWCQVSEEGLYPFSEFPPPILRESLHAAKSTLGYLESPSVPQNAAYYTDLAKEILAFLPETDRGKLTHELGYLGLRLERMLYGIEIAFSNLLKLPQTRAHILLMGTDPLTIRTQGVRLMVRTERQRAIGQRLPHNLVKDAFNPASATIPKICTYYNAFEQSSLPNVLETPILTCEQLQEQGRLPSEYNICLRAATNYMISRFSPIKIIVCLPRDFFQANSIGLVEKLTSIYKSLNHLVGDVTSKDANEGIIFVVDDQSKDQNITPTIKKEITNTFHSLNVEKNGRGIGLGWLTKMMLGFGSSESEEVEQAREEIMEALDAYAFIVNRLTFSSKTNGLLTDFPASDPSGNPQFEALSSKEKEDRIRMYQSLPFASEFEVTKNFQQIDYSIQERDPPVRLGFTPSGVFKKTTFPSSSVFEHVLSSALRYMRDLHNQVAELGSRSDIISKLIESYKKVSAVLRKKEPEKIITEETDRLINEVKQVVDEWVANKEAKEKEIRENAKKIAEKEEQIKNWEKDTTKTEFNIVCAEFIARRSFWSFLFPKKYIFLTTNETKDILSCEFSKTQGSFDCTEPEFIKKKIAKFTPKRGGSEDDSNTHIKIGLEKRKHPDTLKMINENRNEIEELKKKDTSLQTELSDIISSIEVLRSQKIKILENELPKINEASRELQLKLEKLKSQSFQYRGYFEILKLAYHRQSQGNVTNYYGLFHVYASPIPQTPSTEEHFDMKFLSKQERCPVYIITKGNKEDQCFGAESQGRPLFYEYTEEAYLRLESGKNPYEIAKQIDQDIAKRTQSK